jgi:hypothetical protein
MKKNVSLLCNLLLASTLFWGVPIVDAQEIISSVPTETTEYCNLKFPLIREDTLSWERPVLDPSTGKVVDFYGACDYDPLGSEEIRVQRRALLRADFDDGD